MDFFCWITFYWDFSQFPLLETTEFCQTWKGWFWSWNGHVFFGEEAPSNEQSAAICFPTTFFLQEATLQIRFEIHGTGDSAGENFQNFWAPFPFPVFHWKTRGISVKKILPTKKGPTNRGLDLNISCQDTMRFECWAFFGSIGASVDTGCFWQFLTPIFCCWQLWSLCFSTFSLPEKIEDGNLENERWSAYDNCMNVCLFLGDASILYHISWGMPKPCNSEKRIITLLLKELEQIAGSWRSWSLKMANRPQKVG